MREAKLVSSKAVGIIPVLFAALLLIQPAFADTTVSVAPSPEQQAPIENNLVSHGHYVNKDKQIVHSPSKTVTGKAPSGASAQCRDGSYSFSRNHRGTCSHHGGAAQWLN